MTRRELLIMGAAGALNGVSVQGKGQSRESVKLPPGFKRGDRIAFLSPASESVADEGLAKELLRWRALGVVPVFGKHTFKKHGFFGGTDQERADDLMWAFGDDSIKGIFAMRGGYGCSRVLPLLDFALISKTPKIVMGYSDITALLVALYQECGFTTFHGPVVTSSPSEFGDGGAMKVISEVGAVGELALPAGVSLSTVVSGVGEGRLTGGNLSILASLCGTPWQMKGSGMIVFLEDVGEAPYRIDRMLTQLLSAGALPGVRAFWWGSLQSATRRIWSRRGR